MLRDELMTDLYEVYDLERLCGKVTCGSLNARDVLQIKNSLKVLPDVTRIIEELGYKLKLNDHTELYNLLEEAIYEEPPITVKEGYLIKDGYNQELDELKEIRKGGKNFISSIEEQLKQETGINNLKVGYNKVFGYYIEITKGQIANVPENLNWERRQTLTNAERYISPELKEKEAHELLELSFYELCDNFTENHLNEYLGQRRAELILAYGDNFPFWEA